MNQAINDLYNVIVNRKEAPSENSYTRYLFDQGLDKILKNAGKNAAKSSSPPRAATGRA